MFSDIYSLKHNHIVGIQDTINLPGRYLIKEFISNSNNTEIHIFCYEDYRLHKELGVHQIPINFHHCLPKLTSDAKSQDELEKFFSSISERRCNSSKLMIIIDSLSTLMLQKPFSVVYRILHQLLNTRNKGLTQVIGILHEDTLVNPKYKITQLQILCRVWIKVQNRSISITIRKSSGKLSTMTYEYEGNRNNIITWQKKKHAGAACEQDSNEGPISTFKLTLSESEKKARDAVQLPYERSNKNDESANGATIIYEPDEFDDWDEEDPDNDLEFS